MRFETTPVIPETLADQQRILAAYYDKLLLGVDEGQCASASINAEGDNPPMRAEFYMVDSEFALTEYPESETQPWFTTYTEHADDGDIVLRLERHRYPLNPEHTINDLSPLLGLLKQYFGDIG